MNETNYEQVVKRIASAKDWTKFGCLAGVSPCLDEFEQQLLRIPNEVAGGIVICLQRTCLSEAVDSGIARVLGFGDPQVVEACPCAPIFNESLLFGSGPVRGALEASDQPLVIRNVDFLSSDSQERLCRQMAVWIPATNRRVMLAGRDSAIVTRLTSAITGQATITSLQLPPLGQRLEDLPFIIHDEARRHGGGIDHFSLSAINTFEDHEWEFGVGEVAEVVRGLYVSNVRPESQPHFEAQDVREVMDRVRRSSVKWSRRETVHVDSESLWSALKSQIDDINRLSTSLIAGPFFANDVIPATANPLRSVSPELSFLQLVSWAYITIVENGEPNLRCVLRLFSGQRMDPKGLRDLRDTIVSLRTYLQHSLTYSSDHDQATLNRTCAWFEDTLGRRQPELSDFEACIYRLLLSCQKLFEDLLRFLRSVGKDEFRDVVLKQWKDGREKAWPKHKFDQIVVGTLRELGRTDLDCAVVCNQHLKEMQEILAATVTDEDRVLSLKNFIEQRICEKYPLPLPIRGKDLIDLGIPPGPRIGEILGLIREKVAAGETSREALLALATQLNGDNAPPDKGV